MRPIQLMYREFCERMATACEDEANRYAEHPELKDEDRQLVRSLQERCRYWRREIGRLDDAYNARTA